MLAERIADSFTNEGIITEEEKEIVRFGLENLEGNLLGIVMTLIVGFCFHRVWDALLLWILLFPLRKNAGGFHASTKTGCYLISTFMVMLTFMVYEKWICTNILYSTSVLIFGYIIWMLVPVDNLSKKLDEVEHKVYRTRSRTILVLESIFFVVAFCFGCEMAVRSVAMTFFMVCCSLLMGTVKVLVHNKNNDPLF